MYTLRKTTITHKSWIPSFDGTSYTKHWSLKKIPSNKTKKSQYKGETMTNHTLNARPNTLLNLSSGLQTKGNTGEKPWYGGLKNPPKPASVKSLKLLHLLWISGGGPDNRCNPKPTRIPSTFASWGILAKPTALQRWQKLLWCNQRGPGSSPSLI